MKFVNFHRRPVSMFVMVAFTIMLCFWANQSPAAPSAPAPEKSSATVAASSEEEAPGFIEQEESSPAVKKGKKFPWLIVGAVVVVGAAVAFFLLQGKKYALTVTLGEGCTGTPAETAKFKKNAVVNYNYSPAAGYGNLQVKLDGVAVAASGSVTMDKAHTLDVSATYGAIVNITSTPSGAKIFHNNTDSGKTTPASFSYTSAGVHTYLLRQCGYKDYTSTKSVVVGQTYDINATMVPGILDNFLVPSTCWNPYVPSDWTLSGGLYQVKTKVQNWHYNYYNTVFGSSNYTVEVKMKRTVGSTSSSNSIILSNSTNMNSVTGYLFNYSASGYWSIWKYTNYNLVTGSGSSSAIRGWMTSGKINKNLGSWNIMKIVRSGGTFSLYFNNSLITTAVDSSPSDPRVAVLAFYSGNTQTEMQYDYAKLTLGATAGLMAPDMMNGTIPGTNQKPTGHN